MIAPAIMPAIAPSLVERFQNSAASMTGPNVAPRPAHAKDTSCAVHGQLLVQLQVEHTLEDVLGHTGGYGKELRVSGGHRAGKDAGKHQSCDDRHGDDNGNA